MSNTLDTLTQHATERVRRQFPEIYTHKPGTLRDVPIGTFIGGSVWSKLHVARWIVNPNVHIGGGLTYADIARSWIETSVRLPINRKRADQPVEYAPVPLRARRGVYDNVAYVDIRSTYKTILQTCGFDVEYRAMNWLSRGQAIRGLDELPKISYSAIVTMSKNYYRTVTVTTRGGGLKPRKLRNKYANVALFTLVRDLLHAVYSDVVETCDVLYANTDGYIVSCADVERVAAVLAGWGFGYGVKQRGTCRIDGAGSYSFTDRPPRRPASRSRDTPRVNEAFRAWLRDRWSLLVAARTAALRET